MRKRLRYWLLSTCLTSAVTGVQAQDDIADIFVAGADAINPIAAGYFDPALASFGYSLNAGWAQTADTHEKLGFDLSVQLAVSPFGSEKDSYIPILDGTNITLLSETAPTIGGSEDVTPRYQIAGGTTVSYPGTDQSITFSSSQEFDGPSGADLPFFGSALIQAGIGLPLGTDIRVRFLPKIDVDEFSSGLWGVGLQHNYKQWIPGFKTLPFKSSILFGYTQFNAEVTELEIDNPNVDGSGTLDIVTKAWTTQLLVSKKFSVLTIYGGGGYNHSNSNVRVKGTYTVREGTQQVVIEDPLDIDATYSGALVKGGIRFKFGFFTLFGEAVRTEETVYNAGFGISVR